MRINPDDQSTGWPSVKQKVGKYGYDRVISAADFHIKGLHWFASQLAEKVNEWPEQLLLDIIAYAVLDDSKVKKGEHLKVVKLIAEKGGLEFRGIKFPIEQSKRAAELFMQRKDSIMMQYDEIQDTIKKARNEQRYSLNGVLHGKYKFAIGWSEEDQEYAARILDNDDLEFLSWLDKDPMQALAGLIRLVEEIEKDQDVKQTMKQEIREKISTTENPTSGHRRHGRRMPGSYTKPK